jgi:tRNA wybutosine-synthesizing protein 4
VKGERATYILGGVIKDGMLRSSDEICSLKEQESGFVLSQVILNLPANSPRPLLIGPTVSYVGGSLVIIGGSAVCFSFGTYWNKGCYTVRDANASFAKQDDQHHIDPSTAGKRAWRYLHTVAAASPVENHQTPLLLGPSKKSSVNVPRIRITDPIDFQQVVHTSRPVVLENLDVGPCTSKWTREYLKDHIGPDREVRIF